MSRRSIMAAIPLAGASAIAQNGNAAVVGHPNHSDKAGRLDYLMSQDAMYRLMQGWMFRDLGQWNDLATLFHPEATIEVTWFEGTVADFIKASQRMRGSSTKTKHFIATPLVEYKGDRALAETNAVVIVDDAKVGLGCNAHTRCFDRVERRNGVWRILKRSVFYDTATFTFPAGLVEIDKAEVSKYPHEYAALGYLLGKGGFPVERVFPTRGSDQEKTVKTEAHQWLSRS